MNVKWIWNECKMISDCLTTVRKEYRMGERKDKIACYDYYKEKFTTSSCKLQIQNIIENECQASCHQVHGEKGCSKSRHKSPICMGTHHLGQRSDFKACSAYKYFGIIKKIFQYIWWIQLIPIRLLQRQASITNVSVSDCDFSPISIRSSKRNQQHYTAPLDDLNDNM